MLNILVFCMLMLDIIDIRVSNYFEYHKAVKQIDGYDLLNIDKIFADLQPITITKLRLIRLGFYGGEGNETGNLIKCYKELHFRFQPLKGDRLLLTLNRDIKLPHVKYIHQLQNIYYDLTGEVLKRPEEPIRHRQEAKTGIIPSLDGRPKR